MTGGQPAPGTVCSGPARAVFQSRQTSAKGLLVKRTCRPSRPRAEEDFQGRFSLFCRVADGPRGLALRSRPVRGGETAGRPALQGQDLRQGWEEGCKVAREVGLEGVGSGRGGEGPGSLGLARKEELEADSPQRCSPPGTIPCPHSGGPRRAVSHLRMWARFLFLVQSRPAGFSRPSSRVPGEFHHITSYLALS